MDYVAPRLEKLSVTYNDITYYAEYFKPATFTSGVVDETHIAWNVGTVYSVNDYVIIPELKRIYRSASSNTGSFPLVQGNTDWVFWAVINTYREFSNDEFIGSTTTGTDQVSEFDFSRSDTIAWVGVEFVTAQVILFDTNDINYLGDYNTGTTYDTDDAVLDGGILYSSLIDSNTGNTPASSPSEWDVRDDLVYYDEEINGKHYGALTYGEYFYTDATAKKRVIITDLEWLPSSIIRITFAGASEIGSIVYGKELGLGCTLSGSNIKFEDRSLIQTDEISGYRNVIRYGGIRVLDCGVTYDTDDFNSLSLKIEDILSKNILWIPTKEDIFAESITIGYIEDFNAPMNNTEEEKTQTTTTIIGVI